MHPPETTPGTGTQKIVDLITKAPEGVLTTLQLVEELEGKEGRKLVVERKNLQPEPPVEKAKLESPRRSHQFFAAAGFISYLQKYGSDSTVIFADPGERVVQAVLDENSKNGREVVSLAPQQHPRWVPWKARAGSKMTLDAFRDFITANRRCIVAPQGRDLIFMFRQIVLSTDITLQSSVMSGACEALNGILIKSKMKNSGTDEGVLNLPETITIETPVLVDEPSQKIEMDLILEGSKDGTEIFCTLSTADLHEALIAAFDSLVDRLRKELSSEVKGKTFTITHGRFSESPWDRVRA